MAPKPKPGKEPKTQTVQYEPSVADMQRAHAVPKQSLAHDF